MISGLNRHVTTNRPSGGLVDPSEKWEPGFTPEALNKHPDSLQVD
ncbi:hypothetical protein EMIT051CA3_20927 [Pseudomonas chlororaphis]